MTLDELADAIRAKLDLTAEELPLAKVLQGGTWTAGRKIQTFKGDAAFGSWLYRIAANAAYMKLRSRRGKGHEIPLEDVLPVLDGDAHFASMEDWSERVDERALQGELRRVLEGAIDELPSDYRTVLVLHDVEGLPNPEIAEALGLSLPAVKSRVHRSRLFLRRKLNEYLTPA